MFPVSIDASVPVIVSSGFAREDELQEMNEAGLSGFIHKPFHSQELGKIVKTAIK